MEYCLREMTQLALGEQVDTTPAGRPRATDYEGRRAVLSPLRPEAVIDDLYSGSHGDPGTESLWTYMGYGPFADRKSMLAWLQTCADSKDPLFLSVADKANRMAVGMVSFLAIRREMRCLELGHIWYVPQAQGTGINAEAVYLMLREAFDQGYRRVEWKCDSLNARSRRVAAKLGFTFEGVFRQHMIVKGRNRDTAWFSMLDGEWPRTKRLLEEALHRS